MADLPPGASDRVAALGQEKIPRLVLRFTASTLVALLFNSFYSLTDALFVSWGVGDNAMGGVSVGFPFILLQGAIATAVGSGAASIVSRKLGQGKAAEAGEATLNAMAAFYATALLTTLLGFVFLEDMLTTMGVTAELYPFARQYMYIILAGNVFSTGFSSIIRAEGKMLYALMIWVAPVSLNIVLDAVFILALGMGVAGSALATVLAQFTSFCISILFFTRLSAQVFKGARLRPKRVGEVLAIGLPSLVQMGSLSVTTLLVNNTLARIGGTLGVNTFAYVSKILTFGLVPFTAVTQALAPIVGYNYGVGNQRRVRQALRFCSLLAFGYGLVALAAIQLLPGPLLRIFTRDAALLAAGETALRIIAVSFLLQPLPTLAGATFQAMGKKASAFLVYAAGLVFLLPLILLLPGSMGVTGVWWSYNGSALLAAAFVLVMLAVQRLQNTKKQGA